MKTAMLSQMTMSMANSWCTSKLWCCNTRCRMLFTNQQWHLTMMSITKMKR